MDISKFLRPDEYYEPIDNGRWMPASKDDPNAKFLVIGMQSKEAQRYVQDSVAKLREENEGEAIAADQFNEITKNCLADVCLKDWKGIKSNGKNLPFSRELARQSINSRDKTFMVLISDLVNDLDKNAEKYAGGVLKK